jgi:hypothetical protein
MNVVLRVCFKPIDSLQGSATGAILEYFIALMIASDNLKNEPMDVTTPECPNTKYVFGSNIATLTISSAFSNLNPSCLKVDFKLCKINCRKLGNILDLGYYVCAPKVVRQCYWCPLL